MADFSAYTRSFWVSCAVLEALGFAEFVASCTIISTSSGHYVGGIYCGIFCVITGALGFRSLKARSDVLWVFYLSIVSVIISIIAAAVQAAYYNFFTSLKACSTYQSGASNTCGLAIPGYLCYGDSSYYFQAEGCMSSYNYNYGTTSNECSCITSDGDTCYDFGGVSSCNDFVNDLPGQIRSSYIIAFFCLVASLIVMGVSSTALRNVAEPAPLQQPINESPVTAHAVVVQTPPATTPVMVYVQSPINSTNNNTKN